MNELKIKTFSNPKSEINRNIIIKGRQILDLELYLNNSAFAKEWSYIGDYLYKFYTLENCKEQPDSTLEVTDIQFLFLENAIFYIEKTK